MAMLAGPRRKQKVINLRAKNNEWSNDTNKFGQRMLEKMGWSSGKGLGANENGMVEHVVARYKNDDRGLGFEDRNDQWTKHEDEFNSLLANLSNGDNNTEKLHSGVSLEVKSKKSKARVHYHKFTRGKDLTRYSEKDLANIFGKKSLKTKEQPEQALQNDTETTEKKFTEKGSMEDYFKNKMAMKSKNKVIPLINEVKDCEEIDYGFRGFSGTKNDDADIEKSHEGLGFQSFTYCNTPQTPVNETSVVEEYNCDVENPKRKKNKKSKHQDGEIALINENSSTEGQNTVINDVNVLVTETIETEPRKKSKKQKYLCEEQEEPVKKKKSKKKTSEPLEIPPEELVIEEIHVPKKKKKRKNKDA